jgi:cysteine desulfurase
VLAALGRSLVEAAATVRFGLGRGSGEAQITQASRAMAEALNQLRA